VAGEGKDPETRTPQTENATPKTRTKGTGTGEGGRGREPTDNKQQTTNAKSEPIRSRFPNYSYQTKLKHT